MSDLVLEFDWDTEIFGDPGDGKKLSREEAAKILMARLGIKKERRSIWSGGLLDPGYQTNLYPVPGEDATKVHLKGIDVEDLFKDLLTMLPEDMLTQRVIQRMDARALLEPLIAQEQDVEINGRSFGAKEQNVAATLFAHLNRTTQEELLLQLQSNGVDPTVAAEIARTQSEFAPGTVRPVSLNEVRNEENYADDLTVAAGELERDEQGTLVNQGGPGNFYNDDELNAILAGTTEIARPSFLGEADIELLFNTQSADGAIDTYLRELGRRSAFNEDRGAAMQAGSPYSQVGLEAPQDELRIQYRDEVDPVRQRALGPGGNTMGGTMTPTWDRKSYTLTETLKLPNTMSREQLKVLTDRMRDAGLFEGTGEPSAIGNPTDPNFKQAWRNLISQSVQQDRPMWDLLGEAIKGREDAKNAERDAFTAALSDPSTIRLTAQALASSIIGRHVTPEETDEFVQRVHAWERESQQAAYEAGGEDYDGDGDIVTVDWEARMEEAIRQENPEEAEAKSQANQYENFRAMLGGPGYGPVRRGRLD